MFSKHRKIFSVIAIFGVLFVAIVHPFMHQHEIDGTFHSDCPGCMMDLFFSSETASFFDVLLVSPFFSIAVPDPGMVTCLGTLSVLYLRGPPTYH